MRCAQPALLVAIVLASWAAPFTLLAQEPGDGLDDPPPPAAAADPAKAKAAAQKLLGDYRNVKPNDAAGREAVVQELLALGPEGARQIVPELAKELGARRKTYLTHFETAGTKIMTDRLKKPEVRKDLPILREKILTPSRDRNITLEKIQDFADPAKRQLEALLSLTRDEVLKSDASLPPEREALSATLKWWREGFDKLPADAANERKAAPPDPGVFGAALNEDEEFSAMLASVPDRKDRSILQSNREPSKKLDGPEAKAILLLNLLRARVGIGALAIDLKLCEASRDHSKDMSEMNFFEHESPVPGKTMPWDRAKRAGTTATSENLFEGGFKGEDAIDGWWHSPGHHANMMDPKHRRTGIGKWEGYWTQMFGK